MDAYSLFFQRDLTVHFYDLFATYWRDKKSETRRTASILKQDPMTHKKFKERQFDMTIRNVRLFEVSPLS